MLQIGCTSLHLAAQNGHVTVVDILLGDERVLPNAPDKVSGGQYCSQLLDNPVLLSQFGWTPLHRAVSSDHALVVARLVSDGRVDVNACDKVGVVPPSLAVLVHHYRFVWGAGWALASRVCH